MNKFVTTTKMIIEFFDENVTYLRIQANMCLTWPALCRKGKTGETACVLVCTVRKYGKYLLIVFLDDAIMGIEF